MTYNFMIHARLNGMPDILTIRVTGLPIYQFTIESTMEMVACSLNGQGQQENTQSLSSTIKSMHGISSMQLTVWTV